MSASPGRPRRFFRVLFALLALGPSIVPSSGPLLRAADCNGNGVEDEQDIAGGSSFDCNLDAVPDECEHAPLLFGLLDRGIAVPRFPRAVVAADFDADGGIDIATGNQDASADASVAVLLNDGSPFAEPVVYAAGRKFEDLAAADLDGDGDVDLAVMSFDAVHVLLNDGAGVMVAGQSVTVPSATRGVTPADLDGDGLPELLLTNTNDDTLRVLGATSNAVYTDRGTLAAGDRPEDSAAVDLDGDGDEDVVVVNRDSATLSVFRNEAGALHPTGEVILSILRPRRVHAGDVDLDGDLDLLVGGPQRIIVVENDGAGTFTEGPPLPLTGVSEDFIATDIDADSRLDVVVVIAGDQATQILLGLGNGRFGPGQTFDLSDRAGAVVAADLDRDGDSDLAVTAAVQSRLAVLWNGESNTLAFSSRTYAVGDRPHSATIGDLDGDGITDLITANGSDRSISIFRAVGDGSMQRVSTFSSAGAYLNSIAANDLDGDGDVDLLTAAYQTNRMQVYLNDGTGRYPAPRVYATGQRPFMVHSGDLDGDGRPDIIAANEASNTVTVHLNAGGDGTFDRRRDARVGARPVAVVPADVDGDGDLDLAVANQSSADLHVLRNDGGAEFTVQDVYATPGGALYVVAADFDADSDLDLATVGVASQSVAYFANVGDGSFSLSGLYPIEQAPYSAVAADVDGDGLLDIVTSNQVPNNVSVLRGTGDGAFLLPLHFDVGTDPRFTLAADIDTDGDLDLLAANHTSRDVTVLLNETAQEPFAEDYLESICTALDFHRVSVRARGGSRADRTVKYLVPSRADPDLLGPHFQNGHRFELHQEFLAAVFPDRFPALDVEEYNRLVGRRATRDYFVGVVQRLRTPTGTVYGFSVATDAAPSETPNESEVRTVYETLGSAFALEPLGYLPDTGEAKREATTWSNPGFPIYFDDGSAPSGFQPYTFGVGYGRLRVLDRDSFDDANERGEVSFQSILVLDHAPRDIEGVIGGVLTASRQQEQSHLSIRTARRGTPNAFLADAHLDLLHLEGTLVRLEVRADAVDVREATPDEAHRFWDDARPVIDLSPTVDEEFDELRALNEMDVGPGSAAESRFGGKASNFARLQQLLRNSPFARFEERGFAIPVRYYLEFLRFNRIPSAIDSRRLVTYEEHLAELFDLPAFQSDPVFRHAALSAYREFARDNGIVDFALVRRVIERIAEVFGSETDMVRFRSSSNVEDVLEFNGAGLYESTSGCAADSADADGDGPSLCNADVEDERTIQRALKRVWTSLYTFRAFEERSFFGVPEDSVAMAVLVSSAFLEERANGVAFTGNITNPLDRSYVVTVQVGEESVVHPDPDVSAEKDVLEVVGGRVVRILRPLRSSLLGPDEVVLEDGHLHELGAVMSFLDESFPLDLGARARAEVLLDMEIKLSANDELSIKQIRPFLLSTPPPPTPTFELEIPAEVCGVFGVAGDGRGPREELERKSVVRFRGGAVRLPTNATFFGDDIIESVLYGPDAVELAPAGAGLFRMVRLPPAGGVTTYRFTYSQEFALPGGGSYEVRLVTPVEFRARGEVPVEERRVLGPEFFTTFAADEPLLGDIDGSPLVRYGACNHEALPLWRIDADLADGTTLELEERWLETENDLDTGPASLVRATVDIGGERRVVTDYFSLVYSAFRHNTRVHHWVVLDPPVTLAGLPAAVHVVELVGPDPVLGPETARYLDADFAPIRSLAVDSYVRSAAPASVEPRFRRGDPSDDGRADITDAVTILNHLFLEGPEPSCRRSADVDASGTLELTDGLYLLNFLFLEGPAAPPPFTTCGLGDPTDGLDCTLFRGCEGR